MSDLPAPGWARRDLLGATLAAAIAAVAVTSWPFRPRPHLELSVAAGERGGLHVEFAELLVRRMQGDEGAAGRVLYTRGSVANVLAVRDGRARLGLVAADVAEAALDGPLDGLPGPTALLALGRVYENYLQVVVRAEDAAVTESDLNGRRVIIGAEGSGAAFTGARLLDLTGIRVQVAEHRPILDAIRALEDGDTDAFLWSGGIPAPCIAELASRRPVRLLPLTRGLATMSAQFDEVYRGVQVPVHTYGPTAAVTTIGMSNLLVCSRELPDDVASAVVTALVRDAPELIPRASVGTYYLDQRSLTGTGRVPLHPGAAAAYRDLHG